MLTVKAARTTTTTLLLLRSLQRPVRAVLRSNGTTAVGTLQRRSMASSATSASTAGVASAAGAPAAAASATPMADAASAVSVPRSSVDFFASAAPKLHGYVRSLQSENETLRAENTRLRADAEILDGISDFLREMSKSTLNYAEFMAAKTAEVEAAKQKAALPAERKSLPPVVLKPSASPAAAKPSAPAQPPAIAAAISAPAPAAAPATAPASSSAGMFGGIRGGFFNNPPKPKAKAQPAATPAPVVASTPVAAAAASSTAASSAPITPSATATSTVRPKKPSQKRPPTKPAGEDAIFTFTAATAINPPLRHVTPYLHEYHVFAKRRWIGRTLLEVLISDFKVPAAAAADDEADSTPVASPPSASQTHAEAYYRSAITQGLVRVNGAIVAPEHVLRDRDHLVHATHRHEPPVLDEDPQNHSITVVADTDDLLVVSKPCSIPVHESGKYRHNSLLGVLWNQAPYARQTLFPVHRLDKVTSGVVILAKNKEAASRMAAMMKFDEEGEGSENGDSAAELATDQPTPAAAPIATKNVTKIYLARVRGEFPLQAVDGIRGLSLAADGRLHLDAPILTVSLRRGIHVVDFAQGKSASTVFKRLSYDAASNTSVVQVQPLTGRTHQIRLHLQYLQHGIVNDSVYGEGTWQGNTYGAINEHADPAVQARQPPAFQPGCQECASSMYYNPTADGGLRYTTGIYLHAQSYSSSVAPAYHFATAVPAWAEPTFDVVRALGQRVQTSARAIDSLQAEPAASTSAGDPASSSSPPVVHQAESATYASASAIALAPSSASSPSTLIVRASCDDDLPSIHAIYSHAVLHGTGTFETEPPSLAEMTERRAALLSQGMPYLVAIRPSAGGGEVVAGFAYAGPFRARPAYRFCLEDSIYVSSEHVGRGVGRSLLSELLRVTTSLGYRRMLALIGDRANAASIALHKHAGFTEAGAMIDVGWKFDRWLDVVIMQRDLQPRVKAADQPPPDQDPPQRFDPVSYAGTPPASRLVGIELNPGPRAPLALGARSLGAYLMARTSVACVRRAKFATSMATRRWFASSTPSSRGTSSTTTSTTTTAAGTTEEAPRVNLIKLIARAGVASRRDALKLITSGRVSVDGQPLNASASYFVSHTARITIDGKPFLDATAPPTTTATDSSSSPSPLHVPSQMPQSRLWLYYKPPGLLVSHKDTRFQRGTVFDRIQADYFTNKSGDGPDSSKGNAPLTMPRMVSVGRLDYLSEGLLLLTNSGAIQQYLEHPTSELRRTYHIRIKGALSQDQLAALASGLNVDGFQFKPVRISQIGTSRSGSSWYEIEVTEGKNRELRTLLNYFDFNITKLVRCGFHEWQLQLGGGPNAPPVAKGIKSVAGAQSSYTLQPGELIEVEWPARLERARLAWMKEFTATRASSRGPPSP